MGREGHRAVVVSTHPRSQLPTVPEEPLLSEQNWGSEQNPALNECILAWRGTWPVLRDDEGRSEGDARLTCCRTFTYTSSWAWARMKRAEGWPWAVCGLAVGAGHGSGGLGVWLDLA